MDTTNNPPPALSVALGLDDTTQVAIKKEDDSSKLVRSPAPAVRSGAIRRAITTPADLFIYRGLVYTHVDSRFLHPTLDSFKRVGRARILLSSVYVWSTPSVPAYANEFYYVAHGALRPHLKPGLYAYFGRPADRFDFVFGETLWEVPSVAPVVAQLNGTHGEATNEDDVALLARNATYLRPATWTDVVDYAVQNPEFVAKKILLGQVLCVCLTNGATHLLYGQAVPRLYLFLACLINTVALTLLFKHNFVVRSQLNGNNGEATNTDDVYFVLTEYLREVRNARENFDLDYEFPNVAQSSVISTYGNHKFKVENSNPNRREELVHAPAEVIRATARACPKIASDTKKLKKNAEKRFQKRRQTARDLERCEKEFQNLMEVMSPGINVPQGFFQTGFNMEEVLRRVGAVPGQVLDGIKSLLSSVQRASNGINAVADFAGAAIPWLKALLKTSVMLLCAGICIYAVLNDKKILAVITAGLLTAFGLVLGLQHEPVVQSLIDAVSDRYGSNPAAEVYADIEVPNVAQVGPAIQLDPKTISGIFISLFSAGFLSMVNAKKSGFEVLKDYVVHFPSAVKGIEQIVEFSSKIVLSMLNYVRIAFGWEVYDSLLDRKDPFSNWIERADVFVDKVGSGEIKLSSGVLGQANAYIDEGREHAKFLRSISDDRAGAQRLGATMNALAAIRDRCVPFNANFVSSRPEPVCIYLYSPPGRGKTTFAKMFARAWLARKLDPEAYKLFMRNPEAYIYHRTPETDFWDGYANQIVTIFDDFAQKKEVAGGDSAALDVIRCMNGAVSLLHMANLKDKGSSYFTSELVILTSNVQQINSEAIVSNDAVRRRPNWYIEVDFQEKLKVRQTCLNKPYVDSSLVAAINSLPNWEDRASVYVLTTYDITISREIRKGPTIAPLELLEQVMKLGDLNRDKFDHVLPPEARSRVDEAKSLVAEFRRVAGSHSAPREEGPREPPSPAAKGKEHVEDPLEVPKPKNVAQGFLEFQQLVKNPKVYSEFCDLFGDYCEAIRCYGPHSDKTENLRQQLEVLIGTVGLKWSHVAEHYHCNMMVALFQYERLTPPSAVVAEVRKSIPPCEKVYLSNADYFRDLLQSVWVKFKDLCSHVWDLFKKFWPWVLGVGVALATGVALWGSFSNWVRLDNEPQSIPARAKVSSRRRPGFHAFKKKSTNAPQASDTMQKQCVKLLSHNYHLFWSETSEEAFGHVQMLVDRVGITNAHTVDLIEAKVKGGLKVVYLGKFGKKVARIGAPVDCFLRAHRDEDTLAMDLVLVYLTRCGVPPACDFRKNIPSLEDLASRSQVCVLAPDFVANDRDFTFLTDPKAVVNYDSGPYVGPDGKTAYTNELNVSYHMKTKAGHCGLPIVSDSLSQGEYFLGIHKCSNGTLAGAAPVFREWVEREMAELLELYPDLPKQLIVFDEEVDLKPPPSNFPQCHPCEVIGVVPAFHASVETKLNMLPHAHMYDLNTAPAIMETTKIDGHWVNPYIKNRNKIPNVVPVYPDVPDLWRTVSSVINNERAPESADLRFWKRRMTYTEAVKGIPGTVFSGLDLQTSVGYPLVLTGHTTKQSWFADPGRAESIRGEVYRTIAELKLGRRPMFLNMDVLKDERRTLEKVATCATRVVVPTPLVLLIIYRMFFGGYVSWIQINKISNGITIGMNPYSLEWDGMCRDLFGPKFLAYGGDSEGFDLRQHPEMLRALFGACNDWYGDDDNAVRSLLSLEFMFPRHVTFPVTVGPEVEKDCLAEPVPDDVWSVSPYLKIVNASRNRRWAFVYVATGGHVSGSYLTACFNSKYSVVKPIVMLQWTWRDYKRTMEAFHQRLVRSQTLGDDFLTSVHPSLQGTVNAMKFAEFSSLYGMRVTTEDKQPITVPFPDDNSSLWFLKRNLRYDPAIGRYVGALKLDAVIDAMCWIRKPNPTDVELRQLFTTACCEFALWGRQVYEAHVPKLRCAAELTLRRTFVPMSWHEALEAVSIREADYRP